MKIPLVCRQRDFLLHKCSHAVDNIRHFVDGFFNRLFSRTAFCSANHCECRANSKRCAYAFHNISLSIHFHNDSSRTFSVQLYFLKNRFVYLLKFL